MIMVTTATIAMATMTTTIAMTMQTMTVNDYGYITETIAMTTTMTMRMHFFRSEAECVYAWSTPHMPCKSAPSLNGAASVQLTSSIWADSADI